MFGDYPKLRRVGRALKRVLRCAVAINRRSIVDWAICAKPGAVEATDAGEYDPGHDGLILRRDDCYSFAAIGVVPYLFSDSNSVLDEQTRLGAFRGRMSSLAFCPLSMVAWLVLLDTIRSARRFRGLETLLSSTFNPRTRGKLPPLGVVHATLVLRPPALFLSVLGYTLGDCWFGRMAAPVWGPERRQVPSHPLKQRRQQRPQRAPASAARPIS